MGLTLVTRFLATNTDLPLLVPLLAHGVKATYKHLLLDLASQIVKVLAAS